MKRFLVAAALLFTTVIAACAASPGTGHGQIQIHKHPTAVTHHVTTRPTTSTGGYDQNHGAYDPWYWDWSYEQN
jgi:hypothetical protein